MSDTKFTNEVNEQEISLLDIVQFIKESYKKILAFGAVGALVGMVGILVFGTYSANLVLSNNIANTANTADTANTAIDIFLLKYLQAALPNLQQEKQNANKNEEDEFLGSQLLWEKSVKPILLASKADRKEFLDASALNSLGSKIYSIQISSKAHTKEAAIQKVGKMSNFFINGSAFIKLKDLVRSYELKVISIDSNLKRKVAIAEVELEYLQKRIKNLNELKNQYPRTSSSGGQVVDAKDSSAKYLPVITQIVAAITDADNIRETLAKYRDEESQSRVYKEFIEKAKPLMESSGDVVVLTNELLGICEKISTNLNGGAIQQVALEDIKVSLTAIQTNQLYGLKQIGAVDVANPQYLKFIMSGLFAGIFIGLLVAFGMKALKQMKAA